MGCDEVIIGELAHLSDQLPAFCGKKGLHRGRIVDIILILVSDIYGRRAVR